ncbi:alkylmercury lyase family protein [Oscillatoria sp. FACHB-1407]|uniref:alkylmercury lyase family protein n=1 Tax=Oscillatoria sp. FACHB-1407 TaxID=2692847 RepID=UPI001684BE77|nr:alkylmercury lyase family protein [Oscillatoria sp. FACHB-1407]MBD2461475.1 alkylmercury lyase family protein [Oscillatoria sp. FACHB-1407]
MQSKQVNNSILHYTIIKFIIDYGYAPEVNELAQCLKVSEAEVVTRLRNLQDDHGVVLHPNSEKIWVIHPFSLAPTPFLVRCGDREWWGNCAWCSLGIAALLGQDVIITTTLGANSRQIDLHVEDGELMETDLYVHFPIRMVNAWDNVIYTCSTMLVFESESQIDSWSKKHRIQKGDVQPIQKIWEFAKVWYGDHLNPEWKKWTFEEAKAIFDQFGLTNETWKLSVSASRF